MSNLPPFDSVACIGNQVHKYLFNLHRIGFHLPQFLPGSKHQLNVFTDQARQHLIDILNNRVQIKKLQALHLLASKGKQLPRQVGGAARGLLDFIHVTTQRVLGRQRVQHQLSIRTDDH